MDIWKLYLVFNLMQLLARSEDNIVGWASSRQKRYLIWTDSGSTKVSISMSIPANFYDKRKWRSFNLTFNLQFQYNMPHSPLYWWDAYSWKLQRSGTGRVLVEPETIDFTQMYIYALLENYMTNAGVNGRQCMQRAICENAQVHKVEGLMERIYQRLMTPEDTTEDCYKDARVEGTKGVDCLRTYSKCPVGDSIFDKYIQYTRDSK